MVKYHLGSKTKEKLLRLINFGIDNEHNFN
jgi:hypothetical protein